MISPRLSILVAAFVLAHICTAAPAAPAAPAPTPAVELPVFSDGPAKGRNALYQSEKFDAWIDAKLRLFIQPKDGGKAVGGVLTGYSVCYFSLGDRNSWRNPAKLEKIPAPTQQAAKVEIAGEYEEGVNFTHTFEFTPAGVTMLVVIKDPQNPKLQKRPSNLSAVVIIPAVSGATTTTPADKIAELTAGCSMRVGKVGEKALTPVPFTEPFKVPVRPADRFETAGMWGARKVTILMPPTKDRTHPPIYAAGVVASYTQAPPFAGYYVARNIFTREKDKKIVIQVN